MKFSAVLLVAFLTVSKCQAEDLEYLKSPMESPRYRELIEELYPPKSESDTTRVGRITNGQQAAIGQFPYQVLLITHEAPGGR